MIAQLSKRIASFFVHSKVIESENEQVYEYGLELLISTLLNSVIALVLALFSRTLWQCICFLVVFIFLRKSAGGFHAKTHLGCCSILAAVLGIFIVLIKFVHIEEYPIVSLAAVVLYVEYFAEIFCSPSSCDPVYFCDKSERVCRQSEQYWNFL